MGGCAAIGMRQDCARSSQAALRACALRPAWPPCTAPCHASQIKAMYQPKAGATWIPNYHTHLYNLTDEAVRGEAA